MVYLLVEGLAEEISMTKVFIDRPAELRGPTGALQYPEGSEDEKPLPPLGSKGQKRKGFPRNQRSVQP